VLEYECLFELFGVGKMRSQRQVNISNALKKVWAERRDEIMESRLIHKLEASEKASIAIKKHYMNNVEHRLAISNAQKNKWIKIKRALDYCKQNNINLEDD